MSRRAASEFALCVLMGSCLAQPVLNERRVEVEGVFDSERVGERQRDRALDYLSESYEIINDSEQMTEEILDACRG